MLFLVILTKKYVGLWSAAAAGPLIAVGFGGLFICHHHSYTHERGDQLKQAQCSVMYIMGDEHSAVCERAAADSVGVR